MTRGILVKCRMLWSAKQEIQHAGTFTVSYACAANTCTLSSSTGYDTTICDTTSVAITARTWAALLAYASSGTPGVTCGTNAGTFTFSDACAAITCKLSSSTGYDTTSCDTISVAITTAIFTLGCASGYTYRGTPSLHAAPMQALSPN